MSVLSEIHWACQYLVGASKTYLEYRSDDSHTNLGFDLNRSAYVTHPIIGKGSLVYELRGKKLYWSEGGDAIDLVGKRQDEVLEELKALCSSLGFDRPYRLDMHYELPYDPPEHGYQFGGRETGELELHIQQRLLAQMTLEIISGAYDWQVDVRTWPHHFDTGIHISGAGGDGRDLGMGLAIPDSMVEGYYFYSSAYEGSVQVDPSGFEPLDLPAYWVSNGFQGGVLPTKGVDPVHVARFLNGTIHAFRLRS